MLGHPPAASSVFYDGCMQEILGAILTGGASSRMGEDKATVEVAGRPMSAWVSEALRAALTASGHIVVLGNTPVTGITQVQDRPGAGPLSGLAAVADVAELLGVAPQAVLIVAIDHPWVIPNTLRHLVDRYDGRAVVPVHHGVRQVTCAVYPMSVVAAASDAAPAAMGFQGLLDDRDVDEVAPQTWMDWGEDGRSWFSVDEPRRITLGLERFGPPAKAQ